MQRVQLAVGQFPWQVEAEAVITGCAIDKGLMMRVAGRLSHYAAVFPNGDLNVSPWVLRVPGPAADTQSAGMPDLRGNRSRLFAWRCRQLQVAFERVLLIGDPGADVTRFVQPALVQLYAKAMELIANSGVGLKLIGPGQGDAGTVDADFDDQALIRTCSVQRPALEHITIKAGDGALQARFDQAFICDGLIHYFF